MNRDSGHTGPDLMSLFIMYILRTIVHSIAFGPLSSNLFAAGGMTGM